MTASIASILRPSALLIANQALKFVSDGARIDKFATFVASKGNVPGVSEADQVAAVKQILLVGIESASGALNGRPMTAIVSRRDTVRQAVMFVRDHIDDFMGPGVDVPYIPEMFETMAGAAMQSFIDERVLPWVETAPALQ